MLWKRLTDMTNSQHVLKALLLTEFLLRNASERFVLDMKMRIRRFESLAQFSDFKNNQQVTKDGENRLLRCADAQLMADLCSHSSVEGQCRPAFAERR